MATVKLSGGKVVTKEGKVSCTCCGCCMYPANGLGALGVPYYSAADLPEAVTLKWPGHAVGSTTGKAGSTYTLGTVTLSPNAEGTAWVLTDSTDGTTRTVGNCLIRGDGNLTPGNNLVEDQFSAEYTMTVQHPEPIDESVLLQRVELCLWEGVSSLTSATAYLKYDEGKIFSPENVWPTWWANYNGITYPSATYIKLSGVDGTPNIATPVGLYPTQLNARFGGWIINII